MDIEVRQPNTSGREKSGKSSSKSGTNPDLLKIIAAAAVLLVAALVLAWNFGVFRSKPKPISSEQQAQEDQQWQEIQKEAEAAWTPPYPGAKRPSPSGS